VTEKTPSKKIAGKSKRRKERKKITPHKCPQKKNKPQIAPRQSKGNGENPSITEARKEKEKHRS